VVRRRPAGWIVRLRRGRKRRRELPTPRWNSLDYRQRRAHHGPPRRRDHGADRQGSRRALPTDDGRLRDASLHSHRRAGNGPQKARLQKLSPDSIKESRLAGEPITAKLTRAPETTPIGGLKVVAESGWFRRSALRNRGYLQDICREFSRRNALESDPQRSAGDRGERVMNVILSGQQHCSVTASPEPPPRKVKILITGAELAI
jgi:hypothetical protein